MLIRQVKCRRFAGLKDRELTFEQGLNVLLGPNEAGKSTLVDVLHFTLVRDATLNRRSHAGFLAQYAPHPNGDFFDGCVQLELLDGQQLKVEKEWGRHPKAQLELPNGNLVRDEAEIRDLLRDHLQLGEGSLSSLIFARQSELKDAVNRILSDADTKTELGSLLRQTVMELDGVSIEQLKEQLSGQIGQLLGRWDWAGQRPEASRGIDNPWKSGAGEIVKCYYDKERLRRDMRDCQQADDSLHRLSEQVKQTAESQARIGAELERLLALDEDINRRAAREPQLDLLKRQQQELMSVNQTWPRVELQGELIRQELEQLRETIGKLGAELKLAEQVKAKQVIDLLIAQVRSLQTQAGELQGKLALQPLISKSDIDTLQRLRNQQTEWEVKLQAGRMAVGLSKLTAAGCWLTRGFGEREQVTGPMEFAADGYLQLEVPDVLVLEVKSPEIDIEQARREYEAAVAGYRGLLERLAVVSTEQAREVKQQQDELVARLQRLEKEQMALLQGRTLSELEAESQALAVAGAVRDVERVRQEMQQHEIECVQKQGQLANFELQLNGWIAKYGNADDVLLQLVDVRRKHDDIQAELAGLASLPDGIASVDEFKQQIRTSRKAKDDLVKQSEDLKDKYREVQAEQPEESYEELFTRFQDADASFRKLTKQAQSLLRVQAVLNEKLVEMAGNPFAALADSFTHYLSPFTAGNYSSGDINEQFELTISRADGVSLPLDKLSTGTYDGVALALRFAMLEHLFQGRSGLVVLDDCLVDLDPKRKLQAALTIQDFAQRHQVIFTTCDPATAELLGGNKIAM